MEATDDVGLCRVLGASNVAIVDGIRLRHSVPAKPSERLSVLWLGKYVERPQRGKPTSRYDSTS